MANTLWSAKKIYYKYIVHCVELLLEVLAEIWQHKHKLLPFILGMVAKIVVQPKMMEIGWREPLVECPGYHMLPTP